MDYKHIYDKLILKARLENRNKSDLVYFEAHHIKPKSFGGEGDCRNINHPNIVLLTPKEHYVAHLLLSYIYPDSPAMQTALWNMLTTKQNVRYKPSSRTYAQIRERYIKLTKGVTNPFYGQCHTEESKLKISLKAKGNTRWLGKKHNENSKLKLSECRKGKLLTDETKLKISNSIKGGKHYNAKPIICIKTNNIFGSGKELSEHLNTPFSTVRRYLNGTTKPPEWFHYKRINI